MVVACWIDIDSQTLSALGIEATHDAAPAQIVMNVAHEKRAAHLAGEHEPA
jgi:hypothetical protein